MKRFKLFPHAKRATLITAIALIAATGLIVGKANPEGSEADEFSEQQAVALEQDINAVESNIAPSELEFLENFGTTDENALAELLAVWKETFTYTDAGGMRARNAFCERFIDPEGNYGIYGKVIAAYLKEKLKHNRSTPMYADDLVGMEKAPSICPNWRHFDDEMKTKFWVWTFAAMASLESSCGADKRALRGVRGVPVYGKGKDKKGHPIVTRYKIAIGLLQMEKAKSDRSWRGSATCDVADSEIGNTYSNLRCGIDIMEGLISANPPNKNPWPIYPGKGMSPTSYWLKLRSPGGGVIGELMRSFKPCRESVKSKWVKPPTPKASPSPHPAGRQYLWEALFGN